MQNDVNLCYRKKRFCKASLIPDVLQRFKKKKIFFSSFQARTISKEKPVELHQSQSALAEKLILLHLTICSSVSHFI